MCRVSVFRVAVPSYGSLVPVRDDCQIKSELLQVVNLAENLS